MAINIRSYSESYQEHNSDDNKWETKRRFLGHSKVYTASEINQQNASTVSTIRNEISSKVRELEQKK